MGTGYGYNESKADSTEIRTGTSTDSNLESSKPVTGTDYNFKRAQDVSIKNDGTDPVPTTNQEGLLAGVLYDSIVRSEPSAAVERYTYSLTGTGTVAVIDVTYTDATYATLVSVVRTS